VRALGRDSPILMFHVENVAIISSGCLCNGSRGRFLFERPGKDSG
jgi:hypothetical protein